MGNIVLSNEQIKEIHLRFLSDRRIASLNNQIAAIYNVAIPKAIIKEGDYARIVYDDNTEIEANRIRLIISDIIKTDYSELFQQ